MMRQAGTPKGHSWGPLMFLIYVTDLTKRVSSDKSMFADNAKLSTNVNSEKDCRMIYEGLDTLQKRQTMVS